MTRRLRRRTSELEPGLGLKGVLRASSKRSERGSTSVLAKRVRAAGKKYQQCVTFTMSGPLWKHLRLGPGCLKDTLRHAEARLKPTSPSLRLGTEAMEGTKALTKP